MPLAPSLYAQLTASPVNSTVAGRIYPEYDREADKVYPLLVYKLENVQSEMASDGPTGLQSASYVLAAIAPSYAAASQLGDAVQAALDGQKWSDPTNQVNVQGSFLEPDGRREDVVTNPDTEAILFYVTELTFQVWFNALTS